MLLLAALLWIVGPGRATAQEGDALRFFQQNPGSVRMLFRQTPRPAPTVAPRRGFERGEDGPAARRRAPQDLAATPLQPEQPQQPPSIFVSVIGDSLAESLANGLRDHLAVERPEVSVVRRSRPSSGLVRDDYHNWPTALRDLLNGTEKVDLVVLMLGSNDRQALRDDSGSHDFRTDRWREIYTKRVDDMIAIAREKRAPLVWVGMPVFESQRLSADMLYLNEIYKERTSRAGVPYVDIWEGFVGEENRYAATGPDVNGEIVRLRTSDGIHFTRSGARKLGFFVAPDVGRALGQGSGGAPQLAALPQDLSDQIRRDTPGLAPQTLQGALPLPDELPAMPVIRERPLQGPVTELTAIPIAAGGQLMRRRMPVGFGEMGILVEQTLAYGRQPIPKPGRADDFRWPGERPLN